MNNIKSSFVIQDLENLSGIKAHTIRIWEKRYNILDPDRMNRQVRMYDLASLQKMLNISILNNYGHKISVIAKLSDDQLADQAKNIALENLSKNHVVNSLLLAMFSFDEASFEKVYQEEIKQQTFTEFFINVYAPLLNHVGLLWQTGSISPVHEHFVSSLIYQKIMLQTALIKKSPTKGAMHVLFLPLGEIHEIGLLFINYALRNNGNQTLYLGPSVPLKDLELVKASFKEIVWVSGYTMSRSEEEKLAFIEGMQVISMSKERCILVGEQLNESLLKPKGKSFQFFNSYKDLLKII